MNNTTLSDIPPKLATFIKNSHLEGKTPSQIGHLLRDLYNVRIHRLCKVFPDLNEDRSEKLQLDQKLRRQYNHIKKNKHDYQCTRSYTRTNVKRANLKKKLKL